MKLELPGKISAEWYIVLRFPESFFFLAIALLLSSSYAIYVFREKKKKGEEIEKTKLQFQSIYQADL